MPNTESGKIRNVAVIGHRGTGKTSLVEALLYESGTTNRLGSVADKSTVSDYDDEERRRGMSIAATVTHLEWQGRNINLIDTPGEPSFQADVLSTLRVVEGAIVVVSGVLGVEVGTERLWRRCDELGLSRLLLVNLLDRERADFFAALEGLKTRLSDRCVAVEIPIGSEHEFHGVVDLVHMVAYLHDGDGGVHDEPADIPEDMQAVADEYHDKLMDLVAETSDELMERYLEGDEITREEMAGGAQEARHRGRDLPGRLRRGHAQHRLARPARPDRRGAAVARPGAQRARGGGRVHAGVRVQDDRRPVQRQDQPAARVRGDAHVRLQPGQQPHAREGADRPAAGAAGQGPCAGRVSARGRDRRRRQAQGDGHGRRPVGRRQPGRDRAAGVPVAGRVVRDRAQAQGRRGEGAHVAAAAAGGGSVARRPPRPADRRDDRRRPVADARRGDARADGAPVRRRGHAAPAAGAVHGDDPQVRPAPRGATRSRPAAAASSATATSRSSRSAATRATSSSTRSSAA